MYNYANNNPITYIDPDGRISEISYSERDERVSIVIPVKYAEGTTDEQKKLFSETAEKAWSGTFGKYHVKLTVKEQSMGEVNIITFNSTESKTSKVENHKEMTLYTRSKSERNLKWTISHEIGHLMNLQDQYIQEVDSNGKRSTIPKEHWENNIMSQFWGKIEEKNISELLDINTIRLEDEKPYKN